MFNGNPGEVNFKTYSGSKLTSFIALANGSTGMLVGTSVQRKYDFARSKSLGGFYFYPLHTTTQMKLLGEFWGDEAMI